MKKGRDIWTDWRSISQQPPTPHSRRPRPVAQPGGPSFPEPTKATPRAATGPGPSFPAPVDLHPGQTSLLLSEPVTGRDSALFAFPFPGVTKPECPPAGRSPLPRAQPDEKETWEQAAAGLGRPRAGWRLCSYVCCGLWEPGASPEESSVDSDPLPRLPWPPCRGGRKMPVKKKRKSPGVAAAVAEDGGLKKCKISRYHLPPPPTFSLCPFAGRQEGKPAGPGFGAGLGEVTPPGEPRWGARSSASSCAQGRRLVLGVGARRLRRHWKGRLLRARLP